MSGDPTKELRAYIEGLQEEARLARHNQEGAEEDRDRLAEEVRRLQMELEAANEARKEVRSVIVERDDLRAALEKNEVLLVEIRRRADGADRQRAQLESQRDQAMALYKEIRHEADQHVAARDEAVRQRDAALRQRAQVQRDHEELLSRLAESQRQTAELQRALVEAQAGANKNDGAIQKQLLAIRQARDSAAAQAAEFKARIAELEDALADLTYDREVSDKATKKAVVEVEAMRVKSEDDADKLRALETLQGELAEIGQELTDLRQQHAALQGAKDQLVAQLREFRETHETQLIANTSHLEAATKERDVLRARLEERETELKDVRAELAATWASAMQVTEPEIERLTTEVESMKTRAAEVDSALQQSEEMVRQREEMRLQVIELTAQLENARREIKEVGAQLAEARLQLKLANRGTPPPFIRRPEPSRPVASEGTMGAGGRVQAMRQAWKRWRRDAADESGVWDLAREATAFSGSCQAAGQLTAHRVASKLAALAEVVMAMPDAVTPFLQEFIGEGVEFLARLDETPALDRKVRLAGKRVYVVESDPNLCAGMCDALRSSGFLVESTESSSSAIAELSSQPYDLILADTEMPELNGFELFECARNIERHASTPVVLLKAGPPEPERAPGATFLAKPFLADELALRVIIELVRAQIEAA